MYPLGDMDHFRKVNILVDIQKKNFFLLKNHIFTIVMIIYAKFRYSSIYATYISFN